MNSATTDAFLHLRMSDRIAVAQRLNVYMAQGAGETGTEYTKRLLRHIEKEGRMRDLEFEMRDFQ